MKIKNPITFAGGGVTVLVVVALWVCFRDPLPSPPVFTSLAEVEKTTERLSYWYKVYSRKQEALDALDAARSFDAAVQGLDIINTVAGAREMVAISNAASRVSRTAVKVQAISKWRQKYEDFANCASNIAVNADAIVQLLQDKKYGVKDARTLRDEFSRLKNACSRLADRGLFPGIWTNLNESIETADNAVTGRGWVLYLENKTAAPSICQWYVARDYAANSELPSPWQASYFSEAAETIAKLQHGTELADWKFPQTRSDGLRILADILGRLERSTNLPDWIHQYDNSTGQLASLASTSDAKVVRVRKDIQDVATWVRQSMQNGETGDTAYLVKQMDSLVKEHRRFCSFADDCPTGYGMLGAVNRARESAEAIGNAISSSTNTVLSSNSMLRKVEDLQKYSGEYMGRIGCSEATAGRLVVRGIDFALDKQWSDPVGVAVSIEAISGRGHVPNLNQAAGVIRRVYNSRGFDDLKVIRRDWAKVYASAELEGMPNLRKGVDALFEGQYWLVFSNGVRDAMEGRDGDDQLNRLFQFDSDAPQRVRQACSEMRAMLSVVRDPNRLSWPRNMTEFTDVNCKNHLIPQEPTSNTVERFVYDKTVRPIVQFSEALVGIQADRDRTDDENAQERVGKKIQDAWNIRMEWKARQRSTSLLDMKLRGCIEESNHVWCPLNVTNANEIANIYAELNSENVSQKWKGNCEVARSIISLLSYSPESPSAYERLDEWKTALEAERKARPLLGKVIVAFSNVCDIASKDAISLGALLADVVKAQGHDREGIDRAPKVAEYYEEFEKKQSIVLSIRMNDYNTLGSSKATANDLKPIIEAYQGVVADVTVPRVLHNYAAAQAKTLESYLELRTYTIRAESKPLVKLPKSDRKSSLVYRACDNCFKLYVTNRHGGSRELATGFWKKKGDGSLGESVSCINVQVLWQFPEPLGIQIAFGVACFKWFGTDQDYSAPIGLFEFRSIEDVRREFGKTKIEGISVVVHPCDASRDLTTPPVPVKPNEKISVKNEVEIIVNDMLKTSK